MTSLSRVLLSLLLLSPVAYAGGGAAGEPILRVEGDVRTAVALSKEDFDRLPHVTVEAADRDGVTRRYEGVLVETVLSAAQPVGAAEGHGAENRFAIVAKASDGYAAIFSRAETDEHVARQPVIVADKVDGLPLAEGSGPLRIVVPGDLKPERWVKQVGTLSVRFL